MNRRRIFVVACWALLTIFLGWRSAVSGRHPVKARAMDAEAPPPPTEQERAQERAAVESQNRQHVAELTRLEKERQIRSELEVKQRERLMRLQITLANTWSNVLSTNWTVYQELRKKAAGSANKATPCTICDGQGTMLFCVVCENSGKCLDCKGTGKTAYGEPCPTCRGKGKCYLCAGSGKMSCVFCDDGLVSSEGVPPPTNLPLPGGMQQPIQTTPPPQRVYLARSAPSSPSTPTAPPAQPEKPVENSAQPPPPASVEIDTGPRTLGFAALILVGIFALKKRMRVTEPAQNTRRILPPQTAERAPAQAPTPQDKMAGLNAATRLDLMVEENKHLEPQEVFKGFSQALAESQTPPQAASNALLHYFEIAPGRLDSIKTLFSRLSNASAETVRQKILADLAGQIRLFRTSCDSAQLGGVLQLATALEGLVMQMADAPSNVIPGTLRTAASAILLLESLAKPGQNLNLPVRPQFRFLVVDDNAVGRKVVSLALKNVSSEPDLAENGAAALALLEKNHYDVILLDIDMPGMDGFELCTRIRQSELNRATPVIFVTSHCDFESRSMATQSGGQDLIGKPFLAFELAVKALILIIRAPLKAAHTTQNLTPAVQPSITVSEDGSEPMTQLGEIIYQQ